MTNPILVPLDGSAFAEAALDLARRICTRSGAPLHLVRVEEAVPYTDPFVLQVGSDGLEDHLRSDAQRYLEDAAARLRAAAPEVDVSTAYLPEPVPDALAAYAATHAIALVVVAAHERRGLLRLLFGSTAEGIVEESPVPVLYFHPGREGERSWTPPTEFRRILVPLDGTRASLGVLEPVSRLAPRDGSSRLTLLHVVLEGEGPAETEVMVSQLEREAERLREARLPADVLVEPGESARRTILDHLERNETDLVAMTLRHERGFARAILGGTTERVLRTSRVPMLVAPSAPPPT